MARLRLTVLVCSALLLLCAFASSAASNNQAYEQEEPHYDVWVADVAEPSAYHGGKHKSSHKHKHDHGYDSSEDYYGTKDSYDSKEHESHAHGSKHKKDSYDSKEHESYLKESKKYWEDYEKEYKEQYKKAEEEHKKPSAPTYEEYKKSSPPKYEEEYYNGGHSYKGGPEEHPEYKHEDYKKGYGPDGKPYDGYEPGYEGYKNGKPYDGYEHYEHDGHYYNPDPYYNPKQEYILDHNAGEPGTHSGYTHRKAPLLIDGPQVCDFDHGDVEHLCFVETNRSPAGAIFDPEVGVPSFTSYFSCCPKYENYPGIPLSPIGNCVWTLPEARRRSGPSAKFAEEGDLLGSVTAECTITEDSPCTWPLKKGDTFSVTNPEQDPSKWLRVPAGLAVLNPGSSYNYTTYVHDVHSPPKVDVDAKAQGYEGDHYYPDGVTYVRGKADIYKGRVDNFQIANETYHHPKCGKVAFVADFIDTAGVQRCPTPEEVVQRKAAKRIGGSDLGSEGAVPVLKCGTYSLAISVSGSGYYYGGEDYGKYGGEYYEKHGDEYDGKHGDEYYGKHGDEYYGKHGDEYYGKQGDEYYGKHGDEYYGKHGDEYHGKPGY